MGLMKALWLYFENKRESCKNCKYGDHKDLDICYKCMKKEDQFKKKVIQ